MSAQQMSATELARAFPARARGLMEGRGTDARVPLVGDRAGSNLLLLRGFLTLEQKWAAAPAPATRWPVVVGPAASGQSGGLRVRTGAASVRSAASNWRASCAVISLRHPSTARS